MFNGPYSESAVLKNRSTQKVQYSKTAELKTRKITFLTSFYFLLYDVKNVIFYQKVMRLYAANCKLYMYMAQLLTSK